MARSARILKIVNSTSPLLPAAPPPEVVNLESDFVVLLATLLCALICVVGLMAAARCAWIRRSTTGASVSATATRNSSSLRASAAANKGLKKHVLQTLPKLTYTTTAEAVAAILTTTTDCAICLSDFVEGDEMRVLPQCGHGFHLGCVDTWLGSHSSCPSCRQLIIVEAGCHKSYWTFLKRLGLH
ncbi:zf-RING_2 domain-containing protein [Cephalotus follicularis]|uniref:Zf-RING_2 domain-containing protein n=1 Tax=Cephalotus follicularis TaxID=3775 RepID=A0A1Q3D1A4_CEPFO|nr:zf-RING_2 domain-containing protein [Cephalotus follicularis]